ncbi:uncharacterized protein LACBIDRAFT_333174 [Laccaria bicolor S238N-H82]|uniref:Predicted protein n=1 Tax=Laccaria bicolor (strain S238N-H82 / ATCC MYA-4686) TaxID=486041 RepID=B0DV47_LACBS|nr:uncharacterized protein LACBIDRAFT_333174 [Laccaria bicolor S238N-H82]EDR01448.1 predicted protein [Laccaria bicolor S238N-H82]|eukprot:XP_001887800.1 predicted protein [Laccaria bicolor S238N-H82]
MPYSFGKAKPTFTQANGFDTDIPGIDQPLSYEPELCHCQIFDDAIRSRWKAEALAAPGRDVTERMAEWCMEELKYKATRFGGMPGGAIKVYNGDVVKSDTAVPHSIKAKLQVAVRPLEDVPSWEKDWHPGSDEKVLNLVHPRLFPVVYGRTRALGNGKGFAMLENCIARCGEGDVLEEQELSGDRYSLDYQWLPCEVDISGDDGRSRITSYINNLHPGKDKHLYPIIEEIITASIPLWNIALAPLPYLWYDEHQPQNIDDYDPIPPDGRDVIFRIPYYEVVYDPDPGNAPETEGPQRLEGEDDPWSQSYWDRRQRWIQTTRKIIVKLANIELTPEKPECSGGKWHVEGQLMRVPVSLIFYGVQRFQNEHICATALYYYSSTNIPPSSLAFRQHTNGLIYGRIASRQHQHDWLFEVFGCHQCGSMFQNVGGVDTREGRLLTFPNILQHQVQPFELVDRTKPGHRKILALFLVDPNIKIISSANVPCQRKDWWREEIGSGFGALLPREVGDIVFEGVDEFPTSAKPGTGVTKK